MSDDAALINIKAAMPQSTAQVLDASRKIDALNAARILHPFLPIELIPSRTKVIVATANNYTEIVTIPAGATYLYFSAPAFVPFFVSFTGGIPWPITADPNNQNFADPLVSPVGRNFFCQDFRQVTVGIPDAGAVISLSIV